MFGLILKINNRWTWSALGNFTTVVMLITFFSDLLLLPFLAGVVVLLITCTESWSATSRLLLPLSARWFFDRGCWFEAEEPPLFRGWLFTVLSRLFCICSISKAALLSTLCYNEYLIFVCLSKKTRLGKKSKYFMEINVCISIYFVNSTGGSLLTIGHAFRKTNASKIDVINKCFCDKICY